MRETEIEDLAYIIKEAKKHNQPLPIFFLGAGASVTGNIPLADQIVQNIKEEYGDNPSIKKLGDGQDTYAKLMDCLSPFQRNDLLKRYISQAKINVTHIYLAQLLSNGYVDYVLTVNFDNLMLRALALYNEFPSTYDMAILKDLTTTTFKEKSVVYLHGQHHGLWLLNTQDEMNKVMATVPRIFDSIKNKRPWIFIGYSGLDPIFNHVKALGRFDNGLFWVGYNQNNPDKKVQEFLNTPNTNASFIKGYDSDAFMIKLNETLGLGQPKILDRPFSSLKRMLNQINDINDAEHFKGVKERLEIAKRNVETSIKQFEEGQTKAYEEQNIEADQLKKGIIDLLIAGTFDQNDISAIEHKAANIPDDGIDSLISDLYSTLGFKTGEKALSSQGAEAEELFRQTFNQMSKAVEYDDSKHNAFYNWGCYLGSLALRKRGDDAEQLLIEALDKFDRATKLNSELVNAYYNWGTYLGNLAGLQEPSKAKQYYLEAFDKFQRTIELEPNYAAAFYNWGTQLGSLASLSQGEEADKYYKLSFEKFKHATDLDPQDSGALYNWGTNLANLALMKSFPEAEELLLESFEMFDKATRINPDHQDSHYNWGYYLKYLADNKSGDEAKKLMSTALDKFEKAVEYGFESYYISTLFAQEGQKNKALNYLERSIKNNEVTTSEVLNDSRWDGFKEDPEFKRVINS